MSSFSHIDLRTFDAFKFASYHGLKWIPCKNKRPFEPWKREHLIYSPDDLDAMQKFRAQGINEAAYPTEENQLVIIDCDVVPAAKDERSNDAKYRDYKYRNNGNFMAGALNLRQLFETEAQRASDNANEHLAQYYSSLALRLHTYIHNLRYGGFDAFYPFSVVTLTPSGGFHFYFKCENAADFKNIPAKPCANVDIRAKGGIIVAPNSYREPVSKTGEKLIMFDAYIPVTSFKNIPVLPDEIASLLPRASDSQTSQASDAQKLRLDAAKRKYRYSASEYQKNSDQRKYDKFLGTFAMSKVGERNTLLNKMYGSALRLRTSDKTKAHTDFYNVAVALGLNIYTDIKPAMKSAEEYVSRVGLFSD